MKIFYDCMYKRTVYIARDGMATVGIIIEGLKASET